MIFGIQEDVAGIKSNIDGLFLQTQVFLQDKKNILERLTERLTERLLEKEIIENAQEP